MSITRQLIRSPVVNSQWFSQSAEKSVGPRQESLISPTIPKSTPKRSTRISPIITSFELFCFSERKLMSKLLQSRTFPDIFLLTYTRTEVIIMFSHIYWLAYHTSAVCVGNDGLGSQNYYLRYTKAMYINALRLDMDRHYDAGLLPIQVHAMCYLTHAQRHQSSS